MTATLACRRCGERVGTRTKAVARVADALPCETIVEDTWLCTPCRAAAQRENEAATRRRGRRAKWGQWTIRNERLLVFP
jgi:hypothetical protein